jgi:hypothetical protein
MGQYHKIYNLDAMQKLNPSAGGDGLKLMEFGSGAYGTLSALAILLAKGIDYQGPWAGNRIVVSGDYADEGRFVPETHAAMNLYSYDHAEDAGDTLNGADRFSEMLDRAKELAGTVLPAASPFGSKSAGYPGVDLMMGEDGGYETFDALLEAFNTSPRENLCSTIEDVQSTMRWANVISPLAWNYRATAVNIVESDDQERIERVTVCYELTREPDGRDGKRLPRTVTQTLSFPATSAEVRTFLQVEGRSPSRY